MGDPRNVAHSKRVAQEKHHKGAEPGKKKPSSAEGSVAAQPGETAKQDHKPDPTQHEKSLAVLAKLREMEFHSRGNIEKLAELSLTIEDELKQKPFVESIGALYSAQEDFHSKISSLIEAYAAECERLKAGG